LLYPETIVLKSTRPRGAATLKKVRKGRFTLELLWAKGGDLPFLKLFIGSQAGKLTGNG